MRPILGFLVRMFCGLRCRLLLLVLIACVPLIVLTVHKAGEDRRRQSNSWRQRTQRLVQIAEREEQKIVGQTRQLLLAIAESMNVRSGDAANTKKLMDELFASYPRYENLGVIRTNGTLVASAVPLLNEQTLLECRQESTRSRSFVSGKLFTEPRKKQVPAVIWFCHPVFNPAGEVQSVVFAALNWSYYSQFGSELAAQIPKGATWTEITSDGRILVRYPNPANWIGTTYTDTLPTRAQERPVVVTKTGRTETVIGFGARASEFVEGPVTAALSIPRDVLFLEADRMLWRGLRWSALALLLAMSLGWIGSTLFMRRIKALAHSSSQLAAGNLHARTGLPHSLDEIGELTRAFDQMAQSLEQRQLEEHRSKEKLQQLSRRLVEVQETERRQIARELHDEVGQTLTVAEMNLQAALQSPGSNAIEERLVESIEAVEKVQEQVRDLSLNLRPSMLDDLGLEPALRWYTNRTSAAAGIDCKFKADPLDGRLDPIVETECFRVGQEALTNVTRHSGASVVQVEILKNEGQIHLHVKDDGIGFDVASVRERAIRGSSLGLLSMEERAALAGGRLEIISAPGRGTEVHAWFPLSFRQERGVSL